MERTPKNTCSAKIRKTPKMKMRKPINRKIPLRRHSPLKKSIYK
jgi:hypothetical protein